MTQLTEVIVPSRTNRVIHENPRSDGDLRKDPPKLYKSRSTRENAAFSDKDEAWPAGRSLSRSFAWEFPVSECSRTLNNRRLGRLVEKKVPSTISFNTHRSSKLSNFFEKVLLPRDFVATWREYYSFAFIYIRLSILPCFQQCRNRVSVRSHNVAMICFLIARFNVWKINSTYEMEGRSIIAECPTISGL